MSNGAGPVDLFPNALDLWSESIFSTGSIVRLLLVCKSFASSIGVAERGSAIERAATTLWML